MNNLSLARSIPLVVLAACGAVADPADPTPSTDPDETLEVDPLFPYGGGPANPLLVEAPHAATGSGSLFARTFPSELIATLIRTGDKPQAKVVEQRIVTKTADPIELHVELQPPTGSFSREIVSDAVRVGSPVSEVVLCAQNGVANGDPRCHAVAPAPAATQAAGALTASTWRIVVFDEATNDLVPSCVTASTHRLDCVLPPGAGLGYRIIALAGGFTDLWPEAARPGDVIFTGAAFTGAVSETPEWECTDFRFGADAVYCNLRNQYLRFTGVRRARIDFDPIAIRLTANGAVTSMTSPALTWDTGTDDLPGTTY